MKKVSILISNTSTCDVLRLCLQNLEKIKKEEYPELEVIVADNSSRDGSVCMMKVEFPWVKIIVIPNNGLAASLNFALKVAVGDYYLYLGTDGFPKEGTVKGLVKYFEDPKNFKVGAAAVKLLLRNGKQDMDGHRGLVTPWTSFTHFTKLEKLFPKSKLFNGYFLTYKNLNEEHEIDTCITHFFFVRKEIQNQVGTWDEDFVVYGEDLDMCYRIKKMGWKIMYLPQFAAEHWKGVSVGRKETLDVKTADVNVELRGVDYTKGELRIQMRILSTKAMSLFYNKHLRKKYPFFITWFVMITIKIMTVLRIEAQKRTNKKMGIK
ncbi:MAG: glycosyltransferase [Patescibacteria group bacterium]